MKSKLTVLLNAKTINIKYNLYYLLSGKECRQFVAGYVVEVYVAARRCGLLWGDPRWCTSLRGARVLLRDGKPKNLREVHVEAWGGQHMIK